MELKRYRTAVGWTDTPFQGDRPYSKLVQDPNGEIVLYVDVVKMLHEHFFPERGFEE